MLHAHKIIYKNHCITKISIPRNEGGMGVPQTDRIYKIGIIVINKYIE